MTDPKMQQLQKRSKLAKKKKIKEGRRPVCLHVRFEYEVKLFDYNDQNWSGHGVNAIISLLLDLSIGSSFGQISSWVANWPWNFNWCSSCVFSIVSTKVHLVREHRLLYVVRNQCAKVGAIGFSRISRQDRVGKNKKLIIFYILSSFTSAVLSGLALQFSSPKRRPRWLGRLSCFLLKPIPRVQFSPSRVHILVGTFHA